MIGYRAAIIWSALLATVSPACGQEPTDALGDPLPPHALARLGTTRLRHTGHGHLGGIAYSPDGRRMATLHGDIRIWDVATGKLLETVAPKESVKSVDFAADGDTLICYGVFSSAVYFLDSRSGERKAVAGEIPHPRAIATVSDKSDARPLALSADGKSVVAPFMSEVFVERTKVGSSYRMQICLRWLDTSTGKELKQIELKELHWKPTFVAISPDEKWLAFHWASEKERFVLWDCQTGKPVRHLQDYKEDPLCGCFSLDGKVLVTGGEDKVVRLWSAANGKRIRELPRHEQSVRSVAFVPGGAHLLSLSEDRVCLWDWQAGKLVREFRLENLSIRSAAVSPRGTQVAAILSGGSIAVWDLASGQLVHTPVGHHSAVRDLALTADGKALFSAGNDAILAWDVDKRTVLRRVGSPGLRADRLAMVPGGKKLVVGKYKQPPEIWDLDSNQKLKAFAGPADSYRLRLTPDGKYLAITARMAADFNRQDKDLVYLCDAQTGVVRGKVAREKENQYASMYALAFSADGKFLASGGSNEVVRITTVPDCQLVRTIDQSTTGLAFSPDGKILAVEIWSQAALFDVATGKEIMPRLGTKLNYSVGSEWPIIFSPDGRTLARSDFQGFIELWEMSTGLKRGRYEGHQGDVNALAFSADGKRLFSAGEDTTILVWDLAGTRKPMKFAEACAALGELEGRMAYRGICTLSDSPKEIIAYLQERLPTLRLPKHAHLKKMLDSLDDPAFEVREQATQELEMLQELAIPVLQKALADKPPLEVQERLKKVLERVAPDGLEGESVRLLWLRALEVLERIRSSSALQLVQRLADGPEEIRLCREARAVLRRCEKKLGRQT
jgi:WD40 repeat protein